MLPLAAYLVERLGKPTINDPRKIQRTTRDMVAELLTGIPGCRIPKILRQQAGTELSVESLRAAIAAGHLHPGPSGRHPWRRRFRQDRRRRRTRGLSGQAAETDRYFIEYADYRSADGFFRKYRFIFVDGQVLPYHLAICDDWKVHHVNTDMANQVWMQDEEAAFLNDPTRVFNEGHYRALRAIQQRIGLEYFGIDCSLDTNGDLLVFEVNASMLVHDDNAEFPYKDPAVRRIKAAFDAMLRNSRTPASEQRENRSAAYFGAEILPQHRHRFLHRRHELRGEDDGGVLLDRDFRHGLQGAELQRDRVRGDDIGGLAEFDRRLIFAFGGDDLGAAFALGLGFLRHRALHVVGQFDVLDLDRGDLGAPRLGVEVDDVLDLLVDPGGIRQQFDRG